MKSQPTKLTLRLDSKLIERAKQYARERGISLSQIVADYFHGLTVSGRTGGESDDDWKNGLSPITRHFVSRRPRVQPTEEEYRRYVEEKYR